MNSIKTWTLFLDDERYPVDSSMRIARSSQRAIALITSLGMPRHICFDHDLGADDSAMKLVHWLEEALLDQRIELPPEFSFSVHSQNPVGAQNIKSRMTQIIKHFAP